MIDNNPPTADACVLRNLLDRHAIERPDDIFVTFEDGTALTWAQIRMQVRQTAAGLQALGVKQGDHVLSWLPNGLDVLRTWFAINYLGAVYVPLNLEYRGRLLEHAIGLSDARLMIAEAGLIERLGPIDKARLETIIAVGGTADLPASLKILSADMLDGDDTKLLPLDRPIQSWDIQSIILTSGTTGPSKAVLSSYAHLQALCGSESWAFVEPTDRFMINLPLFHIGGTACIYAMVMRGASIAMIERFRTEEFWPTVRRTRSTVVGLMGAMTPFLASAAPSPDDRTHGLRVAVIIPLIGDIAAFVERFGVEVYTVYNMTEISTPLISDRNPTQPGVCGRPRPGVEVRLVDDNDVEVAEGKIGELIIRTARPWSLNSGYYKDPEATARAWRNGWFHTGDSFRRDPDGLYYFVDRQKDAIRRRGENISSFEVEAEVGAHPGVKEVAALAVPSPLGEDEVLVAIVPHPGTIIDPVELIAFLTPRMPRYMVPRYVRIVADLPRTPTAKVQKHLLREEGLCAGVFDREAAGLRIARERLKV
ncbi:AMP-dependent synthetase and ligase [Novosphingobium resinovorum]|uniref:AMP-dependent synthetase and ligase n=1 Tax=Novosphingobium resinovorum TaxID=158500 RepID=A0A031K3C2_9SPHN|nr:MULTISPECIES: AMP-binding protein [Novosphingobium]EZP83102.1 AMP-dependent synthetase and ligase [Novosphingobium resinovorum]